MLHCSHKWYTVYLQLTLLAQQLRWREVSPDSNDTAKPRGRYGHSLAHTRDCMHTVIFGGYDGKEHMNDTWEYHVNNHTMKEIRPNGEVPPGRSLHFACMMDGIMFMHGGRNRTGALKDTWSYDIQENRWRRLKDAPESGFDITGICMTEPKKRMIILGARNITDERRNVMVYDVDADEWSTMNMTGMDQIPVRAGHKVAMVDDMVVTWGGVNLKNVTFPRDVHLMDLREKTVRVMETRGAGPSGRYGHSLDHVTDKKIVMFGGWDGSRFLDDMWILDVDRNNWKEVNIEGEKPRPRALHAALVCNKTMVIFGGAVSLDRGLNDVWMMDMREMNDSHLREGREMREDRNERKRLLE